MTNKMILRNSTNFIRLAEFNNNSHMNIINLLMLKPRKRSLNKNTILHWFHITGRQSCFVMNVENFTQSFE